jgi:hypothetical protein
MCVCGLNVELLNVKLVVHKVSLRLSKVNTYLNCSFEGSGRVKTKILAAGLFLFGAERITVHDQNNSKPITLDYKFSPCYECGILSSG